MEKKCEGTVNFEFNSAFGDVLFSKNLCLLCNSRIPKLEHVSEVRECVQSWGMYPKLGNLSKVRECVQS